MHQGRRVALVATLLASAFALGLLPVPPARAGGACTVPVTQTHRGIQGTFDQCVDRSFTQGGTTYTVHVFYTETTTTSDMDVCTNASPPKAAAECEHALSDTDDADGDNVDAVLAANETVAALRFFLTRARPIPIISGTELNVYIGEDARGGGIPACSLWWDDDWIDGGDVLTARVLAYHEAFHLAQFCQYLPAASGSHGEGIPRAIEDRVEAGLDANLGNLFIPEVREHLNTPGPRTPDAMGNLPSPRGRADALDDQWYWSMLWWTYLLDRTAAAGDAEPALSWDAIDELYDLMTMNATDIGAVEDLLAIRGTSFQDVFRRYGQALFAYRYNPTDPALRFTDAEVTTQTGPLTGHTVRTGAPALTTDTFTMNVRSNRHIEYRPTASCVAVTFEFDGNGQSYGWATLGVDDPNLVTRGESFGTTWSSTVLVGALDRIAGVITSTGSSGSVDVESGCTTPTVEVESPTTAVPAIVGEATDPDRVLARLDVDGPNGEPVQGLTAEAFTVALRREGAELPATVLSAAQVQSDYWLLLDLPDAAAGAQNGLRYDLVARLGTIEGAQPQAVLYAEEPDRDLVLVTDQSGSMATDNKIEAARNAGELLVEELSDVDQAGYVAFDDTSVVRQPLSEVGVGGHRDTVQTAIRNEVPDGGTSIGAGMRAGAAEHDANRDPTHQCAFVLMSDGAENTDPRWAEVQAEVIDNGCPLHVVGLGSGANEPLLQQIAGAVPGGTYDYAGTGPNGTGRAGAATPYAQAAGGATTWQNGLAAIYDLAATRIGDRERILSTGFAAAEAPTAVTCTDQVTVVDWSDADPREAAAGQQVTSNGVVFDTVLQTGYQAGDVSVSQQGTVFFDEALLEANIPACRATFDVQLINGAEAELRINGESETFSSLNAIDGAIVGGATVDVQDQNQQTGYTPVVVTGSLTSFGFGGTAAGGGEFPTQTYLDDLVIEHGEPGGIPIHVDDTAEHLVVTVTAQDPVAGQLSRLYRPDGTAVPTVLSRREPHGSSEVWEVVPPEPGDWRLVVNDQFGTAGLVTASSVSDIELDLLLEPSTEIVDNAVSGAEVPLVALFSGQGGPITGAAVEATVTTPTGFRQTVVLRDDGLHGDGAADDGFYGGSFTATVLGDIVEQDPPDGSEPASSGSYRVDAIGRLGADVREDSGSFALLQGPDGDADGLPDGWEVEHGLDPANPDDATSDDDRDGLDAVCEFNGGSDPRNRDTDGGGEADATETFVIDLLGVRLCQPGTPSSTDPTDDRISPIDSVIAFPDLDPEGSPVLVLTWGDPADAGDTLVDVDIWCRSLERATLLPTGPWELVASDVPGNRFVHADVQDGDFLQCQVDPRVDDGTGDGPREGTPQTSSPVPISDDPYPPEGTVLIDQGAVSSPDLVVDLELTVDDISEPGHDGPADEAGVTVPGSVPGDIEMRIANGPGVPEDQAWVPFQPQVANWVVEPDSNGIATVSVQFRDEAGNVGAGGLLMKDTILVEGNRLSGPSRVETAVDISQNDFSTNGSADVAVVARADTFPDALAGGPLAVERNGPLLLTPSDSLHPATAAELTRVLAPGSTVYVLGGTAAITEATATAITFLGFEVERVAGPTRVETATAIADRLGVLRTLLVANGQDFPDPLIAGAAAPSVDGAVLLVNGDAPHPATDAYLAARPDADVVAVGQPAASAYPEATAISGATADETAVAAAERFFPEPTVVGIARNDAFPDALAGGAHVARAGGPILFTPQGALSAAPTGFLCTHADTLGTYVVYGGTAAISDAVFTAVGERIRGEGC